MCVKGRASREWWRLPLGADAVWSVLADRATLSSVSGDAGEFERSEPLPYEGYGAPSPPHVRDPGAIPYAELTAMGRWWRLVRSGSPSIPTFVCKGCGNVMVEKGFTCSDACERRFHDEYAHDHGTPGDYGPDQGEPTTGLLLRTLLYLALGIAVLVAGYYLGTSLD